MLSTAAAAAGGKRVAVLGAGAAGLVASRLLRDAGFGVRCFEKTESVGGVWRYRPEDVMYRSLVTNLPKEIMAYIDTPFDPSLPVRAIASDATAPVPPLPRWPAVTI
jgi:cation diffusion facilitator CzcD-associated flavoprotein CzcO